MGYRVPNDETMLVVQTHPLKLDAKLAKRCSAIRQEAGRCWSWIVDMAHDYYVMTKKWLSEAEIKAAIKQQFQLDSPTVQALAEKYVANRETVRTLRRNGHTDARYPYRFKRYQTPTWKQQRIGVEGDRLILKMGRGEPLILSHPVPGLQPRQVELSWENDRYYLHLTVQVPKPEPIEGNRIAAVDLGEIHLTAITDEAEALVVSGRQLRAVKRYRNKRVSAIQTALKRCKKGSRKWRKLMKAKHRVQAKTDAQLQNLHHQATAKIVQHCMERGITQVAIGDPEGVQRNTRKGEAQKRRSRKVAQKLSQWGFGADRQYLRYKLKARGVKVSDANEAYTSQHCPACGHRHKPQNRNYRCKCGFTWHRDVLGAWNIRARHLQGELVAGNPPRADHSIKYRHPYRWLQPQPAGESVVARTGALPAA